MPWPEPLLTLAAMASVTRRILLVSAVVIAPLRLTRWPDTKPMLEHLGVPASVADNLSRDSLVRATKEVCPDAIVHLLIPWHGNGAGRWSDQGAIIGYCRIGTAAAFHAAAASGVRRLIAESSITAYGHADLGDRLLTRRTARWSDTCPCEEAAALPRGSTSRMRPQRSRRRWSWAGRARSTTSWMTSRSPTETS